MLEEIQGVKVNLHISWAGIANQLRIILLYIVSFPFVLVGWLAGIIVGFILLVISSLVVGYRRGLGAIKHGPAR